MRRALRFLVVVAPVLSCAALAACTADDDDVVFLPFPDADITDATTPSDATLPPSDATVQMDTDGETTDDDAPSETRDSGEDAAHDAGRDAERDAGDAGDATVHETDGGDAGHDAGDAGFDAGIDAAPPTYTIGGTVVGLAANTALTLTDGAQTVIVPAEAIPAASTPFTFPTAVITGTAYTVTATDPTTPTAQHCTVTAGAGDVADANITSVLVTCTDAFWINPTTGLDTNPGTSALPWKHLTYAIATAPAAGATFYLDPGMYNVASGETFPIEPKSNQAFIGDVANLGNGVVPTQIMGYATVGGFSGAVVLSAVTNVSLSGLLIGAIGTATGAGGTYGVVIDDSSATLTSNNLGSDGAADLTIENGSIVTLTSNTLTGNATSTLSIAGATSTVTARSNSFLGETDIVIALSATLSKLDFGTAASPGGNSILEGPTADANYTGLTIDTLSGTLKGAGNTWVPSVEGAPATGHYAAQLISGPYPILSFGAENFVVGFGANLQL